AAAKGLQVAAESAAAALGRFQAESLMHEQADEVIDAVWDGLRELTAVIDPATSAEELEVQDGGLARTLARLDATDVPVELVGDALELLLSGLRAACLVNDLQRALPLGKAALAMAQQHERPVQLARAHSDIATMYGRRDFNERAIE